MRINKYLLSTFLVLLSLVVHAQDTIIKCNGDKLSVTVLEITESEIIFSYKNESLINRLPIASLSEITFASGRVQKFNALNQNNLPYQFQILELKYIGDIWAIDEQGELVANLERQKSSIKNNPNAMLLTTGIGKVKMRNVVNGPNSPIRFERGKVLLFARVDDFNRDPKSIFNFFKLEEKRKKRMVMLASADSFGTSKVSDINFLDYKAYQYGNSSFILELDIQEPGEYALTLDASRDIFHMFGVD